jgi:transcriptional regulator with XRE-family HTH domain
MTEPLDQGVQRLADVLATVVRVSGRSRQSLEQQIGLSSGYLSKILGGAVELRARHILMVLAAVGMDPADFFRLAYPRPAQPGAEGQEARRLAEGVQAALGQPAIPEPDETAFDEKVKRSLARLLGLLGRSSC